MKLIIAGGRHHHLSPSDYEQLQQIKGVKTVICGGATGVDADAKQWAEQQGISVKVFEADWQSYGKMAGPLRNRQMADYADALAIFPGGKGTDSMFEEARKRDLKIFDFRPNAQLHFDFNTEDNS